MRVVCPSVKRVACARAAQFRVACATLRYRAASSDVLHVGAACTQCPSMHSVCGDVVC